MKRGIVLLIALLLISVGLYGAGGQSGQKATVLPTAKQGSAEGSLNTSHDLAKLKQKGIVFAEARQSPAITKEQAVEIARQSLSDLQLTQVSAEYWDVAHISKTGQAPPALASWVVSFPGLQLPPDEKTGEPRTEITVFVEASSGKVIYMLSYR
ncbi:MAG TPA: hypothetical protein VFF14_05325 [Candidatus Deferrimicrobium sp.]|nr:hypothetical protein [Candidatus Deferrimicrobium sp.]